MKLYRKPIVDAATTTNNRIVWSTLIDTYGHTQSTEVQHKAEENINHNGVSTRRKSRRGREFY